MELSNIRAIIFDLDGVLISTDEQHYLAWKELADELHIPFDRTVNNRFRGVSRMACMDILEELSEGTYTPEEKLKYAARKNERYRELLDTLSPADLEPCVKETLNTLHARGYSLAVGSSSKNAKFILERIDLARCFDAVSDGTNIAHSKPDPEVFLKAAEFLGVQPESCLVVEDAVVGIQAAKAAGMTAAAMGDAVHSSVADVKIGDVSDLVVLLKDRN